MLKKTSILLFLFSLAGIMLTDPDCYSFNDGMTFPNTTASIPEPATMFLLGSGLIILARFVRRKFKK